MFRYYRYPCSFRCGSFSLVVVQSFLPRKLPGIRVCMCSGTVAHYVTYGGFFFFNASRFTGVNTYGGAAANHRTASPRRPAPRRSTTTNRPPFRPVRAFRTWPSALFHVFFLCVFFLFFFLHILFPLSRTPIIDLPPNIDTPICVSALGHGFCNRPMIFSCRVQSRRRVDVASRSQFYASLIKLKRQGKASIRRCRIFFFFFFFFRFLSLFAEHFS